jgi:hypothetical protein
MITSEELKNIILSVFPESKLQSFIRKGYWVADEKSEWRGGYIIIFTLNNDKKYCIKLVPDTNWSRDSFMGELGAISLLQEHNFPVPNLVNINYSKEVIEYPYYISEFLNGIKLCTLWIQEPEDVKRGLYYVLGKLFSKMHTIHHTVSGLLTKDPYNVRYPSKNPTDHMSKAEIKNGEGKKAKELGILSENTYNKINELWEENLEFLKDHKPTLIHYSPFCWNLSFLKSNGKWKVSKMMALGDVLWWDSAVNLAFLKYPPFMHITESHWKGFLQGYKHPVDERRINLYAIMIRICTAMGTYYEPKYLKNPYLRKRLENDVELLIERIE